MDCVTGKGHTPEKIDEIIDDPIPELSGTQPGIRDKKGQDVTVLTGQDGHWVKIDEDDNVIATSNRNLPMSHPENDPKDIESPLR